MQLPRTARIVLVVGGLFVGLFGWMMWIDEAEHGGWDAMDGLEEGHLVDGSVEIREVPWSNREEGMSGSYEVRLVEGVTYEVAFVDREGEVLFTGTAEEVDVWLDAQGEQVSVGTQSEALAGTDEQRATEKSYVTAAVVIGLGILLIIIAVIPSRRATEPQPDSTAPSTPAI